MKKITTGCKVEGCKREYSHVGWCAMHAYRVKKHGNPGNADNSRRDYKSGSISRKGYKMLYMDGGRILEHRYIMEQYLGRKLLPNENIHHKNGNRLDNRIENLELWSKSQPSGQRIEDKLKWANELIAQYNKLEDFSIDFYGGEIL